MSVSVIIPTWNRAKTIGRAIDSVLSQTYQKFEILVCDDGSTDSSRYVVNKYIAKDKRIKWIASKHSGGPAIPRNIGINESKFQNIAFLDSDDAWLPDKLETQLSIMKIYKSDMVCSNGIRVTDKSREEYFKNSRSFESLTLLKLLRENKVLCSSVLAKKDVLNKVGSFPEEKKYISIEDWLTWLKIVFIGKISYTDNKLIIYNDNPKGTIRRLWNNFGQQQIAALDYLGIWLSNNVELNTYKFRLSKILFLLSKHFLA